MELVPILLASWLSRHGDPASPAWFVGKEHVVIVYLISHRAAHQAGPAQADFRELAANGMRGDYSWARPGADYLNIYQHIQQK
jgi:hypothetical protein